MILVTWNCCRGAFATKIPLLASVSPDIAVVPECARPIAESDTCLWFGDNPRQGIAVTTSGEYRIRALPAKTRVPRFVIPLQVTGPESFTLLAVWSKTNQRYRYVTAVIKGIQKYRSLFADAPVVVMGDLNTNLLWDSHHPKGENHTALIDLMDNLGLVSTGAPVSHRLLLHPKGLGQSYPPCRGRNLRRMAAPQRSQAAGG